LGKRQEIDLHLAFSFGFFQFNCPHSGCDFFFEFFLGDLVRRFIEFLFFALIRFLELHCFLLDFLIERVFHEQVVILGKPEIEHEIRCLRRTDRHIERKPAGTRDDHEVRSGVRLVGNGFDEDLALVNLDFEKFLVTHEHFERFFGQIDGGDVAEGRLEPESDGRAHRNFVDIPGRSLQFIEIPARFKRVRLGVSARRLRLRRQIGIVRESGTRNQEQQQKNGLDFEIDGLHGLLTSSNLLSRISRYCSTKRPQGISWVRGNFLRTSSALKRLDSR